MDVLNSRVKMIEDRDDSGDDTINELQGKTELTQSDQQRKNNGKKNIKSQGPMRH